MAGLSLDTLNSAIQLIENNIFDLIDYYNLSKHLRKKYNLVKTILVMMTLACHFFIDGFDNLYPLVIIRNIFVSTNLIILTNFLIVILTLLLVVVFILLLLRRMVVQYVDREQTLPF
jgi:hypothetical protein